METPLIFTQYNELFPGEIPDDEIVVAEPLGAISEEASEREVTDNGKSEADFEKSELELENKEPAAEIDYLKVLIANPANFSEMGPGNSQKNE